MGVARHTGVRRPFHVAVTTTEDLMDSIRIRLKRVIDFGPVVSLSGVDVATEQPMTVHIDCRPSPSMIVTWPAGRRTKPVTFDAENLVLSIDLGVDGGVGHG
jgi:hypothetical protein